MRDIKYLLKVASAASLCLLGGSSMAQNTVLASAVGATPAVGGLENSRNETPEAARRQVVANLNLFRSFSVSVETTAEIEEKDIKSDADFNEYLSRVEAVLRKKLKVLEGDNIKDRLQMPDKAQLFRGINIVKSARCLHEKKDGQFTRMRDLDGQDIVGFPIATLRTNARYGLVEDYKEGFSRIKKDQVFGFLNYCGDEAVPCQYQHAEPFNSGKSLVRKVDWFFVDAEGNESDVLENVVNGRALSQGISLVTLANGKQALIDNNFAETRAFVSAQYDAIEPFRRNILRIRIGKLYGLMTLNGTVKLEPNYESIEQSSEEGIYRIVSGGKVGIMDAAWAVKFAAEFETISDFNKYGLAYAKEGTRTCLISSRTFKRSAFYENISEFDAGGYAQIKNTTALVGLVDSTLQVVLQPTYMSIAEFNPFGLASVQRAPKQGGYITREGREIIAAIYDEVGKYNTHGLVVVRETLKDCDEKMNCKINFTVFDKNGNVILKKLRNDSLNRIRYEVTEIVHSDHYSAILATNETDSKLAGYCLVEMNSMKLVNATPFEKVNAMDVNGYFGVQKDKEWGLMDTLGRVVVKPQFSEIGRFG
ncbi:MAG: hypothetical protein RL757_2875, partial [Bacteroidota bacterium]